MSPTRQFLLDLAEVLDAAPRVAIEDEVSVTLAPATARLLADRARQLAGGPPPALLVMPPLVSESLIRMEFRSKRAG